VSVSAPEALNVQALPDTLPGIEHCPPPVQLMNALPPAGDSVITIWSPSPTAQFVAHEIGFPLSVTTIPPVPTTPVVSVSCIWAKFAVSVSGPLALKVQALPATLLGVVHCPAPVKPTSW
jgi:hypothetical protein